VLVQDLHPLPMLGSTHEVHPTTQIAGPFSEFLQDGGQQRLRRILEDRDP